MTGHATLDTLTATLRAHLDEHGLPQPVSVWLTMSTHEIAVQTGGANPAAELGELLAWAATLREVDAWWWHTTEGNLHVTITGQATDGRQIKAFGGVDYAVTAGLACLVAGGSERVTLGELAALADLLREASASTWAGAA